MFTSYLVHVLLIFCSFERAVEAFASGKVAVGKVTVGKVTVGKSQLEKSQTPRFFRNCNVKIGRRPPASKIAARAHPPLARWAGARSFSKNSCARSALRFRSFYISGDYFLKNSKQKRTSFSLVPSRCTLRAPLRFQIFKFSRVSFCRTAPSP